MHRETFRVYASSLVVVKQSICCFHLVFDAEFYQSILSIIFLCEMYVRYFVVFLGASIFTFIN